MQFKMLDETASVLEGGAQISLRERRFCVCICVYIKLFQIILFFSTYSMNRFILYLSSGVNLMKMEIFSFQLATLEIYKIFASINFNFNLQLVICHSICFKIL